MVADAASRLPVGNPSSPMDDEAFDLEHTLPQGLSRGNIWTAIGTIVMMEDSELHITRVPMDGVEDVVGAADGEATHDGRAGVASGTDRLGEPTSCTVVR